MPFATDESIATKLEHRDNLVNRNAQITVPSGDMPSEVGDYPEIELPRVDLGQEAADRRRKMTSLAARKLHRVHTNAQDEVAIAPLHNGGRRPGDKNLDLETRADIGAAANLQPIADVAEQFGVSQHHVHELKHGKITNEAGQSDTLVDAVNDRLSAPNKLAIEKLTAVLIQLDPEKIKKLKTPKTIVHVASALSKIVQNTTPIIKDNDEDKSIKLLVYAPVMKAESHYETVDVSK